MRYSKYTAIITPGRIAAKTNTGSRKVSLNPAMKAKMSPLTRVLLAAARTMPMAATSVPRSYVADLESDRVIASTSTNPEITESA